MRRSILILLLAGLVAGGDDRPARKAPGQLQDRINRAIQRGTAYLKKTQRRNGSWAYTRGGVESEHVDGGLTALCLYALAASRVPPDDRAIRRGLRWCERHQTPFSRDGGLATYSVSLLILALTRIDAAGHERRIHRLAGLLVDGQLGNDMWTYRLEHGTHRMGGDNSNSQFAVLALWAANALTGYEVPRSTWEHVRRCYDRTQCADGGWGYSPRAGRRGGTTPSMTSAGLCSFVYATAALNGGVKGLAEARGTETAQAGKRALLRRRGDYRNYYCVYSLERAGTVMAIPERLWYFDAARALVRSQGKDGSWKGARRGDPLHAYDTALALLFLSRATRFAVTPGGDPGGRRAAVTRTGDPFPDPGKELERAFDFYRAQKAEDRAKLAPEFGKAGARAVGLLVVRLRHDNLAVRKAAYELLERLVERRFFFEPAWPPYERELMLRPITDWWEKNAERLSWDGERFRVR